MADPSRSVGASRPRRSIEHRLPILIASLLLIAIGVFASVAYRRVQRVLLRAAMPRLGSVSVALDALLAQSLALYEVRLDRITADPAVTAYLRTGRGRADAIRSLTSVWIADAAGRGRVELRRPDGTVALDTAARVLPAGSGWIDSAIATGRVRPGTARIGPFVATGDSIYYEAVASVGAAASTGADSSPAGDPRSKPIGYVVDFHLISGQSADLVRTLIGANSSMLLGSPATGVWSDLQRVVRPPPMDSVGGHPHQVRHADGTTGMGVATSVPGAPWVLWIEQPTADILRPARPLLAEIVALAAAVILGGVLSGWLLSRRITRPIVSLTQAAERIAAGPGATVETRDLGDEVARLDEAFRRMSQRVAESLSQAAVARVDAETRAREARALAQELEQQFEEAQVLSEELEQSNEQLRTAMTDRTHLLESEQAARREAETANKAKGDFLATMSHELRTPLNAIAGHLELVDLGIHGPITEAQRTALARARRSQQHLLALIDDLLNFAKLEAGHVEYTMTQVVLADVVTDVLSVVEAQLASHDLRASVDVPSVLAVHADREKVSRILLNLLTNATKFTPAGGRIAITAGVAGAMAQLSVADTGVGIPQDKWQAIFDPFVQLRGKLGDGMGGTGLGLSISRDLARAMGGDLHVRSVVGEGSTFTIVLPCEQSADGVSVSHRGG